MEDTTQLEKMLSEWLKAGLEEAESWSEMERVARERLQEMGRHAFERMLAGERTQQLMATMNWLARRSMAFGPMCVSVGPVSLSLSSSRRPISMISPRLSI